jgi:hypothetical protein
MHPVKGKILKTKDLGLYKPDKTIPPCGFSGIQKSKNKRAGKACSFLLQLGFISHTWLAIRSIGRGSCLPCEDYS